MTPIQKQKSSQDLKGKGLRLDGLVAYQDGAIVSREVVSGQAGTVTAFAFDVGQQLSEHTAPFDAMVVGLDGRAEVTVGGRPQTVGKDEMIIMPADVPHSLRAVDRFKMLLVMIKK